MSVETALALIEEKWPKDGIRVSRDGLRTMVTTIQEELVKRDAEVAAKARAERDAELRAAIEDMPTGSVYRGRWVYRDAVLALVSTPSPSESGS